MPTSSGGWQTIRLLDNADGREIVAAPRGGALAFFEHLLTRRQEPGRRKPVLPLPADYRVEIRDESLAAA
jgi:hypothetical protein